MDVLSRLDLGAPGTEGSRIRAFQLILALVICGEYWTKALSGVAALEASDAAALGLASGLAVWVVAGRARRAAFGGIALLQTWYVWNQFPLAGNHRYLELILAVLFALLDADREDECRLLLRAVRWTVIVVLFYSGLQKLVHGYYFGGEFLAYSMWRESFRAALGWLLPGGELSRLAGYGGGVGDGPYHVTAPVFVIVSNAVWILEIGLALLLFFHARRTAVWIAACGFVVFVQLVARELMFGIEFASGIALFARGDVLRRCVAPAAVLLALAILVRLGALPSVILH